ncbi:MAG: hypothetical protein A2Z72_06820 [Omnitrophica bacterium RBG_13_46_9]|nr:MAG: hypothetical protein A2Z72_06820 [Omnitrophica bacterium RBG_13_46_9]
MKKVLFTIWICLQLSAFSFQLFPLKAGLRRISFDESAFGAAFAEETPKAEEATKFVGSFFDAPVPEQNYFFVKSVIAVFGNRFGKQPTTEKEVEDAAWDQLLLSFEAFRRGITVDQEEVNGEVNKILQTEGVPFDWRTDKESYEGWLKEKTNESPALFENQIRHMIQLQKLKTQVIQSIEPAVTEEEAFQGFLNENSSIDLELVQFDVEEDAVTYYTKVKSDPAYWEKEKSEKPENFRHPGGVTCQFLIDFWKIPEKPLQDMVKMKPGEFHNPEPIYKGWGVFKVLGSTQADESKFTEVKNRYSEKVRAGKRSEGFGVWFENLKKEANIKKMNTAQTAEIKVSEEWLDRENVSQ